MECRRGDIFSFVYFVHGSFGMMMKSPWYVRAWRRFKNAVTDLLTIIGLLIAIIGSCLFLFVFGVWVLLILVIVGVATAIVALITRL